MHGKLKGTSVFLLYMYGLESLIYLDVDNSQITDISGVFNLNQLEELRLWKAQVPSDQKKVLKQKLQFLYISDDEECPMSYD